MTPDDRHEPRFISLVLGILALGITPPLCGEVTLTELDGYRVRIDIDGKLFTEYRYEEEFFPILYPIVGPNGETVTRHYPMKLGVAGEQSDREHHRSLWFTHGDVNGFNFWAPQIKKNEHNTEIVHDRFKKTESGADRGELVVWTKWIGDDRVILRERKHIAVIPVGRGEVLMDYDVELHALDERSRLAIPTMPGWAFEWRGR